MTGSGEVVNVDQARIWDGPEGDLWVAHAEHHDRAVSGFTARLADGARIAEDERVLDIGCGNGETTRDAARAATRGRVVGIDLSGAMLARARSTAAAEGVTNIEFVRGDAQVYPFARGSFDVAVSRFGSMFFSDPVAAFTNVAAAIRSGGRLALMAWRPLAECEWFSEIGRALSLGRPVPTAPAGAPGPFGLSDPDFTRGVLDRAGFVDVVFEPVDAEFEPGSNADEAFAFVSETTFSRLMLDGLDADDVARALDELRSTLAAHDTGDGVKFGASAWLVTAARP